MKQRKKTYEQKQAEARNFRANRAFLRAILDQPPVFRLKFAWHIITGKGFGFENER